MKKKILAVFMVLCFCTCFVSITGCNSSEPIQQSKYAYNNGKIDIQTQQYIEQLIENWAAAYKTHDLMLYNDCVSDKLKYRDNSENNVEETKNYFDTVTDCTITYIDFKSAKKSDNKVYSLPVSYNITYNEKFKEENGLKTGENNIKVVMVIKESSGSKFYIDDIQ